MLTVQKSRIVGQAIVLGVAAEPPVRLKVPELRIVTLFVLPAMVELMVRTRLVATFHVSAEPDSVRGQLMVRSLLVRLPVATVERSMMVPDVPTSLRMLPSSLIVTNPPASATLMPNQLVLAPSSTVLLLVTVRSHCAMSALVGGMPPTQLLPRLRLSVLLSLTTVAAEACWAGAQNAPAIARHQSLVCTLAFVFMCLVIVFCFLVC